ncbi:MAG: hypothetical protein IKJ59_14260 [Clostridia bacterium]|nr:hypothetical protein [Clostridia bacterium]
MDFVKTPLCIDDEICETTKGLIQGMPLSPVLCNIYFHCADEFFAENGIQFIRYADDIVFFGMDVVSVTTFYQKAVEFFEKELRLTCNEKNVK